MKAIQSHLNLTASIASLCLAGFLPCGAGDLAVDNLTVETNAFVNGNVGIGNTNPAAKLHVTGDSVFTGNVGVGTTTPTNKLDVAGNGSFSGTLKSGAITSTGSISGTAINGTSAFINNGANGFASFAFYGGYGGVFQNSAASFTIDQQAAAPIYFRTDGGTYRMSILNSSGNVGIGTNSPGERLDVVGNGKFSGVLSAANFSGSSSGTNTGDETRSTITNKLGPASSSADGYLTASDWNTFNSKLSSPWSVSNTDLSYTAGRVSLDSATGNSDPGLYVRAYLAGGLWVFPPAVAVFDGIYTNTVTPSKIYGTSSKLTLAIPSPSLPLPIDLKVAAQSGEIYWKGSGAWIDSAESFPLRVTQSKLRINGEGSIKGAAGFDSFVSLEGVATMDSFANYWARSPLRQGEATSTIGTAYGVYLEGQKQSFVSDAYGIYQAGVDDKNYFNGKVGVGTASPSEKLHVTGGNVKVEGGQFIGNGSGLLILPQGDLAMGTFIDGPHP